VANRFVEMWRWQGTIDRKKHAVTGCTAFVLKYFRRQVCGVRGLWSVVVFVELLAAAGTECACEYDSSGYAGVCGDAVGFGAAFYLAGCNVDGPAIA